MTRVSIEHARPQRFAPQSSFSGLAERSVVLVERRWGRRTVQVFAHARDKFTRSDFIERPVPDAVDLHSTVPLAPAPQREFCRQTKRSKKKGILLNHV